MQHVGEVVLDRGFEVAVADPAADVRRLRGHGQRRVQLPVRGEHQRLAGHGRDPRRRVGVVGRQLDAARQRRARLRQVAALECAEPDETLGQTREPQVAQPGRQVAGLQGIHTGPIDVAGPQLHQASLDERLRSKVTLDPRLGEHRTEMAGRGGQVPSSAVHPAERDLDPGQVRRRSEGGRGLERGDRRRVLTQAGPQLADPGMRAGRVGRLQGEGR